MKKMVRIVAVGAIAVCLGGCQSLVQDTNRSDLKTQLVPAKFKPTVEVMKDKGIVRGTATKSYWFWLVNKERPETFAREILDGREKIYPYTVENAALYDACKKSGASIILAPRFTYEEYDSFLWFSGKITVTVEGVPARIVGAEEIPVSEWPTLFGDRSGTQKVITVGK